LGPLAGVPAPAGLVQPAAVCGSPARECARGAAGELL